MHKHNKLEKTMPHIGQKVKSVLKEQRTTQKKLGQLTGWSKTTVSGMIKRKNWNGADMLLAGQVLNHNFVVYLLPEPPEATVSKTLFEEEVKARMRAEARIKELEDELLEKEAEHKGSLEVIKMLNLGK